MLTRLWFALSLLWAALWGVMLISKEGWDLNAYGWGIVLGPLLAGLLLKKIGQYVATGH